MSLTGNYKGGVVRTAVLPTKQDTLYAGLTCNDGRPITESWKYNYALATGIPIRNTSRKRPCIAKKDLQAPRELLVDKYRPKTVADIIGHKDHVQQITAWIRDWVTKCNTKGSEKGLLITGPPGIGKSSTVHLLIKSLGFHVVEYNASDVRSVSMLQGIMALGIKRLRNEIIVMDEVDGLASGKERGGVGTLADIIRASTVPIICIANDLSPKLKPLQSACLCLKFHRPVKSTIATAIFAIAKKEGIAIGKAELETMCEESGNDIRSILNTLDFHRDHTVDGFNKKDALLRLDAFSATQRLLSSKKSSICDAEALVYVDYSMVPLMVQEAYAHASTTVDELERASELLSHGDLLQTAVWKTQDWSLLPLHVFNTVAVSKTVTGPAPFNIFPQILGKMSKKSKHARYVEILARKERVSAMTMRLTYADPLQTILVTPLLLATPLLAEKPNVTVCVDGLIQRGWDRDDLLEHLPAVLSNPMEIATKVKSAITREFTKRVTTGSSLNKKRKMDAMHVDDSRDEQEDDDQDEDEQYKQEDNQEDDVKEVEERLKIFGI